MSYLIYCPVKANDGTQQTQNICMTFVQRRPNASASMQFSGRDDNILGGISARQSYLWQNVLKYPKLCTWHYSVEKQRFNSITWICRSFSRCFFW